MFTPEPSLTPPEGPRTPLYCSLCLRAVPAALELPYGPVCPACLAEAAASHDLDGLAALLCAPVVAPEPQSPCTKEVFP